MYRSVSRERDETISQHQTVTSFKRLFSGSASVLQKRSEGAEELYIQSWNNGGDDDFPRGDRLSLQQLLCLLYRVYENAKCSTVQKQT